jgi:hypothetical protein
MTKKKLLKNIVKGAAFVERMECIALIDKRMSKEHLDQLYEEGTSRDAFDCSVHVGNLTRKNP